MHHALASVNVRVRATLRAVDWRQILKLSLLTLFVVAVSTVLIYAEGDVSGDSVPWEGALEGIVNILTGRTARFLAALMFVGGAILWGFSRSEDGMSTIGKVILSVGLIIGSLSITDLIFAAMV